MKKSIRLACLLLILVLSVLGLTACGKTELPFNDYVSLEYNGYSGSAVAVVDFNYSKMMRDFSDKLSDDETSNIAKQLRKIEPSASKLEKLANGDVVDIEWGDIDTESLAELGIIPVYSPLQITVEGLEVLTEIDLFEGIEYSIEGYEGFTRTSITKTPGQYSKYGYSLTIENGDNLKNGDNLIINAECDELDLELMAYDGFKPASLRYEVKVENIKPLTTVNPFEYASPAFYGTAPEGNAYMAWNDDVANEIAYSFDFVFDKSEGLSNGDTVKITVDDEDDNIAYYARRYGYYPSVTEMEVTVSGLRSNLTSIDLLSEDTIEEFKTANIENLYKDVQYTWSDYSGIRDIAYCGSIISKEKENEEDDNNLYFIYKIDLDNEYDGAIQVYWYSKYKDVMSQGDGTTNTYTGSERTPRDNFKNSYSEGLSGEYFYGPSGINYYVGFESMEKLTEAISAVDDIIENRVTDVEMVRTPKTSFIARLDYSDHGYVYDYPEMDGSVEITEDGTYTVTMGEGKHHSANEQLNFARLGVKILGIGESNDVSNIKISNIKVTLGSSNQEFTKVKAFKGFVEEYPGNENNMAFYVNYDKDVDGDGNSDVSVVVPKGYESSISITFKITGITSSVDGNEASGEDGESVGTEDKADDAAVTGTEDGTEAGETAITEDGAANGETAVTEDGATNGETAGTEDGKETVDGNDVADMNATYDVKLSKAGDSKLKVISKLRSLTGLGLADAKTLVDNAPAIVAENADAATAQNIKDSLEEVGAVVELIKK